MKIEQIIDTDCLVVVFDYVNGLISYTEAQKRISEPGDHILAEMLNNGFRTSLNSINKL